jgi:23S rRNA (guanosine2251-2'-O)-methyltransferase
MIIYGINAVSEALAGQRHHLERIFITRGKTNPRLQSIIDSARERGVGVRFEPVETLTRKAQTPRHQDVVAEMSEGRLIELEQLLAAEPSLLLALDGIEDPRNLGAVLRTAEAVGVQGVILPQRHTCGITPTVVQVSAGAALHLGVARVGNLVRALETLKEHGFWIVGLDMSGRDQVRDLERDRKIAVVIGGENRGVRPLVRKHCDYLVSLPMTGKVASLNLSVAAGVLLYQLLERDGIVPTG